MVPSPGCSAQRCRPRSSAPASPRRSPRRRSSASARPSPACRPRTRPAGVTVGCVMRQLRPRQPQSLDHLQRQLAAVHQQRQLRHSEDHQPGMSPADGQHRQQLQRGDRAGHLSGGGQLDLGGVPAIRIQRQRRGRHRRDVVRLLRRAHARRIRRLARLRSEDRHQRLRRRLDRGGAGRVRQLREQHRGPRRRHAAVRRPVPGLGRGARIGLGHAATATNYPWLAGNTERSATSISAASTTPATATCTRSSSTRATTRPRRRPRWSRSSGTPRRRRATSYTTVVAPFDAYVVNPAQAAVPVNWQISFTGSTGGSTNIHEIGNLKVCAQTLPPAHRQHHCGRLQRHRQRACPTPSRTRCSDTST